jgi:hypothetical protein
MSGEYDSWADYGSALRPWFSKMRSDNPIFDTLWPEASLCFEASLREIGDLRPFWGLSRQKT